MGDNRLRLQRDGRGGERVFGKRARGMGAAPLESPALGTATHDVVRPCDAPRPPRGDLPPPPREPAVAVALSGGGFRAALAVSSVAGGGRDNFPHPVTVEAMREALEPIGTKTTPDVPPTSPSPGA